MKNEKYGIKGMSCAACSASIQNKLSKEKGVLTVNVNLLSESMDISYDETILSREQIFKIVASLGYSVVEETNNPLSSNTKIKRGDNLKLRFWLSMIFLIPLLYLSMGHMIHLPLPQFASPSNGPIVFAIIQFILTTPILIINYPFFIRGFKHLFKGSPNMDTLVAFGSLASYIYSIISTIRIIITNNPDTASSLAMNLFYESAAMILTLVTLGKWLENRSKKKTGQEIENLYKFIPDTITIEQNGLQSAISINDLKLGDIVVVKQDEYISVDGTIIEGHSFIDRSAITGESMPIEVTVGDYVTSATINKNGYLKIKVEKLKEETTIAKIIKLVQDAGSSKAPIEKLADKISFYFVPIVCIIALITFILWLVIAKDIERAFNMAISVLVISCPCALGLATPIAIMVATGRGASLGILFKNAETLQIVSSIKTIMFDKTGTLTTGNLEVVAIESYQGYQKQEILSLASSLEKLSNHPIAKCICDEALKQNIEDLTEELQKFEYLQGMGAIGYLNQHLVAIGNLKLCTKYNVQIQEEFLKQINEKYSGQSVLYVIGSNKEKPTQSLLAGIIVVSDQIKDSGQMVIANLKHQGIKTIMITGDAKATALAVGKKIGIDEVYADLLPEQKLEIVKQIQQNGRVMFVGDGINDSPSLKQADVGIAISSGNDIAIDSGDIVLVNDNLNTINTMIKLSSKTMNNIKGNLFWAFFYNIVGIVIAAGALASLNIYLNPMIAAGAMSLSSLFVVGNALRLRTYNLKKEEKMRKTINIEGMSCTHCSSRVEKALTNIPCVTSVKVNLKKKCAVIEFNNNIEDETLIQAVTDAGYQVTSIK